MLLRSRAALNRFCLLAFVRSLGAWLGFAVNIHALLKPLSPSPRALMHPTSPPKTKAFFRLKGQRSPGWLSG